MTIRPQSTEPWVPGALQELVFPARCCVCHVPIATPPPTDQQDATELARLAPVEICEPCRRSILPNLDHACPRCGAVGVVVSPTTLDCQRCRRLSLRMQRVVALGNYQDPLKQLVLAIKRERRETLAFQLGRILGAHLIGQLPFRPQWIVPVPIHWWKRLRRGFHAPLLIADGIASQTGWPVARDVLTMRRLTMKQGTLSTRQRIANMRNSMMVRTGFRCGGPVVLVDDVMTSGATLNEAAKRMADAGAERTCGAVLARGVRTT